jgi:quercetin dioxygenase-like cupin family protein
VGCVTSGEIAFQLDGKSEERLRVGDAFYEPPGARVLRFDNISETELAEFVAFYPLRGDMPLMTEAPS